MRFKVENVGKELDEQHQEPLSFLKGYFKKWCRNWTIYDKKAFAIVKLFNGMDVVL